MISPGASRNISPAEPLLIEGCAAFIVALAVVTCNLSADNNPVKEPVLLYTPFHLYADAPSVALLEVVV
jgi:hypothetical protein